MEPLKITTFQAYIFWENISRNLDNLANRISALRESTDLIILPEMFNTGFTNNVEKCAEKMGGQTMMWMYDMARMYECVVCGSLIIEENGRYFNRFIWMNADGTYVQYDKRHLFSLAKEDQVFTPGNKRIIVELKGWKICPMICYDLRFPVWSRNLGGAYDILLYVANWPDARSGHWKSLIPARAIENQAFVIGVNRVGHDGNELYYSGNSMCISPTGNVIYFKPEYEDLYTFTIYPKDLEEAKSKYPFLKDSDAFTLHLGAKVKVDE